jgi:PIN domain nuclease of toxin-antitoxin system
VEALGPAAGVLVYGPLPDGSLRGAKPDRLLVYLDTHLVAWLYAGRVDLLSRRACALIDAKELRISPAVILELQYLQEIDRLTVGANAIVHSLSAQLGLQVCDLPFAAVIESAIEQSWTRDPFDRIIVGQAALNDSALLTKDRTIRRHYGSAVW